MIFRCAEFVLIRVYEIRCWRFTPICGSRCSCRAGGGISGAMHCPPSKPLVRLPSCLRDPSASFDSNETLLSQWSPSTAISSFTSEASDISLLSQAAAFLDQGSPTPLFTLSLFTVSLHRVSLHPKDTSINEPCFSSCYLRNPVSLHASDTTVAA